MSVGRRFRLWLADVPVVSMLTHRWHVLHGSVVIDYGFTKKAAIRRQRAWVDNEMRRPVASAVRRCVSWW